MSDDLMSAVMDCLLNTKGGNSVVTEVFLGPEGKLKTIELMDVEMETFPTRALVVGWIGIHRAYSRPDEDGMCSRLYRLSHIPHKSALCDVASDAIHDAYDIASQIVATFPHPPMAESLDQLLLFQAICQLVEDYPIMLPREDHYPVSINLV